MIAKGLSYYIGHSHSPKACRDGNLSLFKCSALFVPISNFESHYLCAFAGKSVDSPRTAKLLNKVSLAKEYLRSPTVEGFPILTVFGTCRYMSIMTRDLAKGWHETGPAGCHCAFVRLWPWQGMLKLMQQWLQDHHQHKDADAPPISTPRAP